MALTLARYRGALLGLAVADAVGAAVEFMPRNSFPPVTDLTGGGPWQLEPGQWTDDTSMALCLAESLLAVRGFDALDQMQRYVRWWKEGHWSCKGYCFDIGNTTRAALGRFLADGNPFSGSTNPQSAGNGSIMRLAPIPMAFARNESLAAAMAAESARTTHGAHAALDACRLLAIQIVRALHGEAKQDILAAKGLSFENPPVEAIARGAYLSKDEHAICGSGYVVESLEAALWCFARTSSYHEAVLKAANLGDDADTTAAVVGQLAGAHYGVDAIPAEWLALLAQRAAIEQMADDLFVLAGEAPGEE